jgi:uncharacterized protein YjaZ
VSADVSTGKMLNVVKFINHTSEEIKRNKTAVEKVHEVVKSDCFENVIMSRELIQTGGLSNKQVVEKIRNSSFDMSLEMYRRNFSRVNGYTYPNSKNVWLNRKYHSGASICAVASNLAHEYSHKIGFSHDYKPNKSRPYSTPYSINYAFEVCCGKN